jgi:hypothetical protein
MVAFPEGVDAKSGRRATRATVRVHRDELVRKRGAAPEFLWHTLEWLLQPLRDAAVTDRGGPSGMTVPLTAPRTGTDIGPAIGIPGSEPCLGPSPSGVRGAISRAFWNRASGVNTRWCR